MGKDYTNPQSYEEEPELCVVCGTPVDAQGYCPRGCTERIAEDLAGAFNDALTRAMIRARIRSCLIALVVAVMVVAIWYITIHK